MTYVYTSTFGRAMRRMLAREIRKIRRAELVERGLLVFGGESGGA